MNELIQKYIAKMDKLNEIIYFFCIHIKQHYDTFSWYDMASGTTYYLIMGFIPFLVFLVNVMLYVMASQIDFVLDAVTYYMPEKVAVTLSANIQHAIAERSSVWMWMAGLFSMWNFVKGIEILIRATDSTDFYSGEKREKFSRRQIRVHTKGIIFTFGMIFTIIISLGLTVFGNAVVYALDERFPLSWLFLIAWNVLRFLLPFGVMVLWLTIFYIAAPHSYTPSFFHSFVTSLIVTGIFLFVTSIYSWAMLIIPGMGAAYGPLIGLFGLLIWFNFIARSIIFGIAFLMAWNDYENANPIAEN